MENVAEFHTACREVLAANDRKEGGWLMPYAAAYANVGVDMTNQEEIQVQCLYIISNLCHWRGEKARETKAIFKKFSK